MIIRTYGWIFLCSFITSCGAHYETTVTGSVLYVPGKHSPPVNDPMADSIILPWHSHVSAAMDVVLAQSAQVMQRGIPESLLGDFVADASLMKVRKDSAISPEYLPDFCILNTHGFRSILPKGSITRRNVFEVLPFENELVILRINPAAVNKLLVYIRQSGGVPVSGLRMSLSDSTDILTRINGVAYEYGRKYTLLTNDYLASGGDYSAFLLDRDTIIYTGHKVRDVIESTLYEAGLKNQIIEVVPDGRIAP